MNRMHSSPLHQEQGAGARRSPSVALRAVLTALSLVLGYLPGLGCVDQVSVEINGNVQFSAEHLRPDLQPLGVPSPPLSPFYSDGDRYDPNQGGRRVGNGTERVSELYFSNIPGDKLSQLHRSKCFWVEEGAEDPIVSYEAIFHDVELPEIEEYWEQISICKTGIRNPATREPVMFYEDGEPVGAGQAWVLPGMDVMLTASQGGNGDSYHSCELEVDVDGDGRADAGDSSFRPYSQPARRFLMSNAEPLGVGLSELPVCAIRAATPPVTEDTSYSLDLVNVPVGETILVDEVEITVSPWSRITQQTHHLEPRVKVVKRGTPQQPFTVVRPMVWRDELPDLPSDVTTVRQHWSWQVPIDAGTGLWHENFSYNLEVIRVELFTRGDWDDAKGEYQRVYLSPRRIRAYAGEYAGDPFERRIFNCRTEGEDDGGPRACEEVVGFTPTYAHATPSQWLTWVAEFHRVTQPRPCGPGEGPGICEDVVEDTTVDSKDPVFIEFTVVNSAAYGTASSGLMVSPVNGGHFGNVWVSDRPSLENAFWLQNYGTGNVLIEEIGLDGRDAADFSARARTGSSLPFVLGPDLAVPVSIAFLPKTMGQKFASLYVRTRTSQGKLEELRVPVSANAVDYVFHTLSGNLQAFVRDPLGYADELDFSKALLLINSGGFPMPRGAIWIEGFNADAFSVVTDTPDSWDPSYGTYEPWRDGGAPPAKATVDPGRDEWLYVIYHPRDGYRDPARALIPDVAELVVEIGNEEHRMPLRGMCWDDCRFDPPSPPASGGSTGSSGGGSKTSLSAVGSSLTSTIAVEEPPVLKR